MSLSLSRLRTPRRGRWLQAIQAAAGALVLGSLLTGSAAAAVNVEYKVRPGDTLSGIAGRYGVTARDLASINGLSNPNFLWSGQALRLPVVGIVEAHDEGVAPVFELPLRGIFTARFGQPGSLWKLGYHPGLDIAAPYGSPIAAAAGGTVLEAESHLGYGTYVKIDHGRGLTTLYGHLSTLYVRVGDRLSNGQKIGAVGMTGVTTGPHLHWEVRQDGERRDPERYLP